MDPGRDDVMALPQTEVPMIEAETVRVMRELSRRGWGCKRIARELSVARNTVKRYLRGGETAERRAGQSRCALDEAQRAEAVRLLDGPAEGNAVVVTRLLREQGARVSVRTVERAVAGHRRSRRAQEAATVRFETAPGEQMQVDFGEKRVRIAGQLIRVYFFVAVLSYSRRIFTQAFLAQRQDDWREGLQAAFRHFGGVVRRLLIDNAGALVVGRDAQSGKARLHPDFAAFCADQGVEVRVCQPYRARTKGKGESGVKYVKRNAVAGLSFVSFTALQGHLCRWCLEADERVHGTTHEAPRVRFERDERLALRALASPVLPVRQRRLQRRVATDCLVDVDTVRYSVPHGLVRERVEVLVGLDEVRVFHEGTEVARHRRALEPHAVVRDPSHYKGLWRAPDAATRAPASGALLAAAGRSLEDYARIVAAAAGGAP